MKSIRKYAGRVAVLALMAAPMLASAAAEPIDTGAATDGITAAKVAALAVLAAMIGYASAIFGLKKVLGLINRG
jgi:hypothetical protein